MKLLEIGAGSGYVCALLAEIAGEKVKVSGVELIPELFEKAKMNLELNGTKNVELKVGDGSIGWKEKSPFDRIIVSAACPFIPKKLFEQLKEKGRIVAPVGDQWSQRMVSTEKIGGKPFTTESTRGLFVFVPLKGEYLKT